MYDKTYESLVELLNYYRIRYYDENNPAVTDEEYDILYDKLEELEKEQGWKNSSSPTNKVGGKKGKIKHAHKLYSLKKTYSPNEIKEEFTVCTPKIDGTNLTISYKNRFPVVAATRGDGEYGEDATRFIPFINYIPKVIDHNDDIYVNGECVTLNDISDNFRNYVSGALALKDLKEFATRNIAFIAHDVYGLELDYLDRMNFIKKLGFTTVIDNNLSNFPCDGKVYRVNSFKLEQELGYNSKSPRFAIALKERNKNTAISQIQEIEWNIGRTGLITPLAIISPVIIDGCTIKRVTLHNYNIVFTFNIKPGDEIAIERAGDIIPKFLVKTKDNGNIYDLSLEGISRIVNSSVKLQGPRLYVDTGNSETIAIKNLQHFIKTMKIKGLGPKTLEKSNISTIEELYDYTKWSALGKIGENIAIEVENSKKTSYEIVLAALGIPNVGLTTAKRIVEKITCFSDLEFITSTDIERMNYEQKQKIENWYHDNKDFVNKLPLNLSVSVSNNNLLEKQENMRKICVTGKMDISKDQLSKVLKEFNFQVVDSVTKDCYLLINAGDHTSTKYKKASQYGINIINYWDNKKKIISGQI